MTRKEWDEQAVAREITSEDSPVGIDAKKTHLMILKELDRIQRRLDAIEARIAPGGRAE